MFRLIFIFGLIILIATCNSPYSNKPNKTTTKITTKIAPDTKNKNSKSVLPDSINRNNNKYTSRKIVKDTSENQRLYERLKKIRLQNEGVNLCPCKITNHFPFGPTDILNHEFPYNDNSFVIDKSRKNEDQPHCNEFFNIWKFYVDEMIKNMVRNGDYGNCPYDMPIITKSVNVTLYPDEDLIFEVKYADCVAYRFPNIGPYQTYYYTDYPQGDVGLFPFNDEYENYERGGYGDLVLYNPINYHAKIIESFHILLTDGPGTIFRFFYITRDKKIIIIGGYVEKDNKTNIFNGVGTNPFYKVTISRKDTIEILKNGKIKLNRQIIDE